MDLIDALFRQGPAIAFGTVIYLVGILFGLAFTVMYGVTAPWWRSAIGRMFMVIGTAIVMAGVVVLLSLILGGDYPGRELVRVLGYGIFTLAMGFLFFTYLHERRKPSSPLPIRKTTSRKGAPVSNTTPPTETPNVVIENPKTRKKLNTALSAAAIVLGTAIAVDGASPAFDISAFTIPASVGLLYLSGAFGFTVTLPNYPKR